MPALPPKINGFTLIELLVVISIIAVLSTIGIVTYQGMTAKARDSIRKSDLNKMSTALELYFQKNNQYIPPVNTDPDSCTRDTANFYTEIAPFMPGGVPKDPNNSQYCYYSPSADKGQSYRLFAKLDSLTDQEMINCTPPTYNYTVTSTDLTPACPP